MMTHWQTKNATPERKASRERLDAMILKSLGSRRAYRADRGESISTPWDTLEENVMRGATFLWEIADVEMGALDDLLAFLSFMAREVEVTESLDLDATSEWQRLQMIAPRAIDMLDMIGNDLGPGATPEIVRAIQGIFNEIRAELVAATRLVFPASCSSSASSSSNGDRISLAA